MKVKTLIEQLKNYDPEEEILVAYWSKEFADEYVSMAGDREEITAEQWAAVVDEIDNDTAHEYGLQSIGEIINAAIEKIVLTGADEEAVNA